MDEGYLDIPKKIKTKIKTIESFVLVLRTNGVG